MVDYIQNLLEHSERSAKGSLLFAYLLAALFVILLSIIAYLFAKTVIIKIVKSYIQKSKTKWYDVLINNRFLDRLIMAIPAIIISMFAPVFPKLEIWIQRLSSSYLTIVIISALYSILDSIDIIYSKYELSKERPIKGVLQVIKIIFSVIGTIVVVSILMDKSPWVLLSGIGVFSAVFMLIFQDSISGFVSGIQLTSTDMVRVGDRLEMPNYNANGDVIEMGLHTVKVQNYDKSVTMIPTNALVKNSFINWRGVNLSGVRLIRRSVYIDMTSIKPCTEETLQQFEKYDYISGYINSKRREIDEDNRNNATGSFQPISGRGITNIGVFRVYMQAYIENHPRINKDMSMMVRQLQSTEYGLPIEIYCFADTSVGLEYESIQSDIFDHIFAVIPQFELRVFQVPSGQDLKMMKEQ